MKKKKEELHISHFRERGVLGLYFLLRFSVIAILVLEIFHGNWNNVFLCVLTLVLFLLPVILDKKFNIELPTVLEIIILLFIYAAEILGEIQNFYGIFKSWDTILHTINGFIMAAIGFSLIDILNNSDRFHINLTPIFVALVAFCFSMTIGVLWEFFEYGMDVVTKTDMQKDRIVTSISTTMLTDDNTEFVIDNIDKTTIDGTIDGQKKEVVIENGYLDIGLHDTIKDLIVNCIGAIVFSFIGYLYILGRNNGSFIKQFIPLLKRTKKVEELSDGSKKETDKTKILKDDDKTVSKTTNQTTKRKRGRPRKENNNLNKDENNTNKSGVKNENIKKQNNSANNNNNSSTKNKKKKRK